MNDLIELLKFLGVLVAVNAAGIGAMVLADQTGLYPIGIVGVVVAFVSGVMLLPYLLLAASVVAGVALIAFLLWSILRSVFDQVIAPAGDDIATFVLIGIVIGLAAYTVQTAAESWQNYRRRRLDRPPATPTPPNTTNTPITTVITTPAPRLTLQPVLDAPRARLCRACGGRIEANQANCPNQECPENQG